MSSDASSDAGTASGQAGIDTGPLERALAESIGLFGRLTAEEFESPSACEGWTVRTVLAHLAVAAGSIAGQLPPAVSRPRGEFEAMVDIQAREFAERSPEEMLAILRASAPLVLGTFGRLPGEYAAAPVDMGTAGTYPFGSLADALTFDNTCHVRWDVLAPRGPVRHRLADIDGGRLAACVRWLIRGIPQMTTAYYRHLVTDPLAVSLTGPGATAFRIMPRASAVETGDGPARATVHSTVPDFILWATGREQRQGRAEITGDIAYANTVLDAFRVY
jgi:uncharacterized protein (TIGR03083 family)